MPAVNRFGSHSPPLAASSARVSELDVLLTAPRERLTVSSRNTPPLGAEIVYRRGEDGHVPRGIGAGLVVGTQAAVAQQAAEGRFGLPTPG